MSKALKKAWVKYDCVHDTYTLKLWNAKKGEWQDAEEGVYPFKDGDYIHYSLLTRVLVLISDGYSVTI